MTSPLQQKIKITGPVVITANRVGAMFTWFFQVGPVEDFTAADQVATPHALQAFAQLRRHATPAGLPKFGYLLESDGRVVGAVLLICSLVRDGDQDVPRCNLSSWYVDAAFRAYAPMLVSRAMRHKDVTYVNVSPAPHTRP